MDEATDIRNHSQLSVCIKFSIKKVQVEKCLGFYNLKNDSSGEHIAILIL